MIGMGAAKASVHTGTLEPGTDRQLAASLHYPKRCTSPGREFGIAHAVLVALEVGGALAGLLTTRRSTQQRLADTLELTGI